MADGPSVCQSIGPSVTIFVPDVSLGDYRSLRNQGPLSVGVSVCLSFCDAWVCTDHEIYVVAVIVAS